MIVDDEKQRLTINDSRGIKFSMELPNINNITKDSKNTKISKPSLITYQSIIYFVATICATILYLLSLKGCEVNDDACFRTFNENVIDRLLLFIMISSLLFAFQIFFSFLGKLSKITMIINFAIIAFLTLYYDTGTDLVSHGGYNRILFYLVFFTSLFTFSIIYLLARLVLKTPFKTLFIISSLCIITYYKYSPIFKASCDLWDKGFKNSTIDNSLPCKIIKPRICTQVILDDVLDVSRILGLTCENFGNNKKEALFKYLKINNSTSVIGYPRVEKYNFLNDSVGEQYQVKVLEDIIDMDDKFIKQEVKDSIEFTVNFTTYPPIANLNLKKNETLVGERSEIRKEKKTDLLLKNVFILFLDSLSRNHLKRKLNKVYKWIEKYYNPDNSTEYESFQLMKYHSTGTWTNPNMIPAFFGVPYYLNKNGYLNKGKINYIKHFKERGYITGSTTNACSREIAGINELNNNLQWEAYDHELSAIFCDPNFQDPKFYYTIFNGPFGILHKCLYDKLTAYWSLDYAKQFLTKYKDEPKVFRAVLSDAHEGTGENVKYIENDVLEFLDFFINEGHLKDSVLFIMSDHGYTMPGFHSLLSSPDFLQEITLPFLNILLPRNLNGFDDIRKNLKEFEQLMVTPYDIHKTLLSFLKIENANNFRGNSLFFTKAKDSMTYRRCQSLFTDKMEWCRCSDEL
jgi:hypothetical protein